MKHNGVGHRLAMRGKVSPLRTSSLKALLISDIAYFLPWIIRRVDVKRPKVEVTRAQPGNAQFHFFERLNRLTWQTPPADAIRANRDFFGTSPPVMLTWYYVSPICHNFEAPLVDNKYADEVTKFRYLATSTMVQILTKGTDRMVQIPTPSSFARY